VGFITEQGKRVALLGNRPLLHGEGKSGNQAYNQGHNVRRHFGEIYDLDAALPIPLLARARQECAG